MDRKYVSKDDYNFYASRRHEYSQYDYRQQTPELEAYKREIERMLAYERQQQVVVPIDHIGLIFKEEPQIGVVNNSYELI